jgi:hypothetical protein
MSKFFKIIGGDPFELGSQPIKSCGTCEEQHLLLTDLEWNKRGFCLKPRMKHVAKKFDPNAKCNVSLYSRDQVRPAPRPPRKVVSRHQASEIMESLGKLIIEDVLSQIEGDEIYAVDMKSLVNKAANRLFIELAEAMDLAKKPSKR